MTLKELLPYISRQGFVLSERHLLVEDEEIKDYFEKADKYEVLKIGTFGENTLQIYIKEED